MDLSAARAFALGALGAVLGAACLTALPAASSCPGDPVYELCPASTAGGVAGTVAPPPGIEGGLPAEPCAMVRDTCLRRNRGDCACKSDFECTRSASTCYPAPDCPSAVRSAAADTECLTVSATFVTTPETCTCGCASCAATCDGKGPVLGPDQTIRVELPSEVPLGKIGTFVRARGRASLTVGFRVGGEGPPIPISDAVDVTSDDFVEKVDLTAIGPPAGKHGAPPGVVEIHTDAAAGTSVEIDCVVVFVAKGT